MIKDLLQTCLDEALYPDILAHDQRKTGPDVDEYVVYSSSGDIREFYADDVPMIKNADITVRYYYRSTLLDNYKTRQKIRERESTIEEALEKAGFVIPYGYFDGGDVDDIGYFVTVFECEYWRAV